MTLEIPVPSFVKKYLSKRYGEIHTLSPKSLLGQLIIESATKRYIKPRRSNYKPTEQYTISITKHWCNKKAYNLKKGKLSFITQLLIKLFFENMVEHLIMDQETGSKNAKQTLLTFLSYYDITESDLKFETAYMYYRRKKKAIEKHKDKIF